MSVMLDQEEQKTAEGLLCLLSITVKILTRPWLKTTDSLKNRTHKGGMTPPPQWPFCPGWRWPRFGVGFM